MLPAAQHAALLRLCLDRGAHFACTSYTSDELAAADGPAREAGLVVLTEAGLDPGIDHVLAHDLVARARKAVGDGPATVAFTSYCGGVPAVPNDFRYRFSWAPRGVLSALQTPARAIEHGRVRDVARPWEATTAYALAGEPFEVYPNRDSLPFVTQYDLPVAWRPRNVRARHAAAGRLAPSLGRRVRGAARRHARTGGRAGHRPGGQPPDAAR